MKHEAKRRTGFEQNYFTDVYESRGEGERESVFQRNLEILLKYKESGNLLDIGCAYGEFLQVAQNRFRVTGIDVSRHAISKAKTHVPEGTFKVVDTNGKTLPFTDMSFDAVTCFDVIEHLKSTEKLFSEIRRVLKKSGVLFLTTPGHGTVFSGFFGKIVPDDPTHINKRYWRNWLNILKSVGFTPVFLKGSLFYGFPPVSKLRELFAAWGLPIWRSIVFSPSLDTAATIYMIFRKK